MRKRNRDYIRCEVGDKRPVFYDHLNDDILLSYPHINLNDSTDHTSVSIKNELKRRFRVRNLITRRQFAEDHWQTLFHLEYPTLTE